MKLDSKLFASEGWAEWRRDWAVPLIAMIGSGATTIHFTSMGMLLKPMQADTGWSLSDITAGVLIYAIVAVFGGPLIGRIVDHFGAGRVALVGFIAYQAAFAVVGLAPQTIVHWWLAWGLLAMTGILIKNPVWSMPVVKRFDRSRGMALALMGCGIGFFTTFLPYLVHTLSTAFGWRMTYAAIAGIMMVAVFPLIFLVWGRKDFDKVNNERAAVRTLAGNVPGPDWREALKMRQLWQLMLAGLMVGAGIFGILVHLAPMLQEKDMPNPTVAMVVGALGFSALAGRFITGYLLDICPWPRAIGAVAFVLPIIACLLYLNFDGSVISALLIVVLFGFASGAEMDVLGFLTARYLGLRSYGICCGIIIAVMALGGGAGPWVTARLRDIHGDYQVAITLLIGFLFAGSLLIALLGRSPDYTDRAEPQLKGRPA